MPEPVPDAPLLSVIQFALLVAVHVQALDVAVTLTLAVPPAAGSDCVVGLMVKPHDGAASVTVTVCPATVNVPVCAVVLVFGATV